MRTRPRVNTTLDPKILQYFRGSRQLGRAIDSVLLPMVEENGQSTASLLQELSEKQELSLKTQSEIAAIYNQLQARSLKSLNALRTASAPADTGVHDIARGAVQDELDAVARRFRLWRREYDRSKRTSKAKRAEAVLTFCADTIERTPLLRGYTPETLLAFLEKATGSS